MLKDLSTAVEMTT